MRLPLSFRGLESDRHLILQGWKVAATLSLFTEDFLGGTFDPLTYIHMSLIHRGLKVIGVLNMYIYIIFLNLYHMGQMMHG